MPEVETNPQGRRVSIPCPVVKGAAQAIDFHGRASGAGDLSRMSEPGGSAARAEVTIGAPVPTPVRRTARHRWAAGTATLLAVARLSAPALGAAPTPSESPRPPFLTSELFAFHSEPEINLHHFLFRWATLEAPPGARVPDLPEIPLWESDLARQEELSEAEREAWTAALAFYRDRLVGRSMLFDRELVAIRDALTGKGSRESVVEAGRGVFAHLDRCLPVYERHWWDRHDRTNREWVAVLAPSLVRHEREIASRIAAAYEAAWPSPPNRVDVLAYSNRTSAYTTGEPGDTHTAISSADPALRMPWAFEMLFHEHSHSAALEGPLTAIVEAAFDRRGAPAPGNLWHILLFATAGEAVRSVRVAAGEADYVPYAQVNRVFSYRDIDRRSWEVVRERWLPALAAGEPLSAVIDAIAADLAARQDGSAGPTGPAARRRRAASGPR